MITTEHGRTRRVGGGGVAIVVVVVVVVSGYLQDGGSVHDTTY